MASYHENGTVTLIKVKAGHIDLEAGADVNGIYIYNNTQYNEDGSINGTKDTSFENVKITLENGVEQPKLARSAVKIADAGTKVCTIVDNNTGKDYYLFMEGVYEQVKTVAENGNAKDNGTWVDGSNQGTAAEKTAHQIANEMAPGFTYVVNEETKAIEVKDSTGATVAAEQVETAISNGKSAEAAESASALKGSGTQADPFLIYDYETFQKVTSFYGKGYNYFEVAIEKTNNGHIDCSGWNRVYLQGSIEGNGVILDNVDDCLFEAVQGDTLTGMNGLNGSKGGGNADEFKNTQCIVSNMDVNCNIFSTGNKAGLIRSAGQNILIDNVDVHGKIQAYCGAAYIGYGVGQFNVYNKGVASTWYFKNCESDALIQATTENVAAFIVNEYSGSAGTITLDNSGFTGYLNQKDHYTSFNYGGIALDSTISYINDSSYASKHNGNTYTDSTKCVSFTTATPVAQSQGLGEIVTVDKVSGATMALVNLTFRVDDGVVNIPLEEDAVEKKISNVNKWCSTNILNAKVVWGENLSSHYDGDTYYYQYDGTKVEADNSYICITQYNANGLIIARSQLNLTDIQKISN